MILLIDNYDSFVYNLARYVNELGYAARVVRNNALTVAEIAALQPSHIIISPGPAAPDQAGVSLAVIRQLGAHVPILGVCLGHQAIGQAYGGQVVRALRPMHGKASTILHEEKNLFNGIDNPVRVARYHSLIISSENFPAELRVTARCEQGEIMAVEHREYPVFGVQFHPESVLTDVGYEVLRNFLE